MAGRKNSMHPKTKNTDPYILLSEAIVLSALNDLKRDYRKLKKALLKGWPTTECEARARFSERFFFSELYFAITELDGKRVIKCARHSVGIDYQGGRWVLLDGKEPKNKHATSMKGLNISILSYVYRHFRGNTWGWPTARRNALKFYGANNDITEKGLLMLVDRYAPGWRARYSLHSANDIRNRLEVEGFTTTC